MSIKTSMTQVDFYELRKSLGLNRHEAALVLNITVDTLRKWEGSKSSNYGPHPTAVIYLQVIRDNPELVPPFWPSENEEEDQNNGN